MWITEVGYTACDPRTVDGSWCVPGDTRARREARKARWLGDLLAQLARPRHATVDAVFVYSLYAGYGGALVGGFGLIARDGRHLAAWSVFRAAAWRIAHR